MIKRVGTTEIKDKHLARCHCGAVVLELALPDGIVNLRRCSCSICRMKGTIMASVPFDGLRVIKGKESLRLYQFNTKIARHYFCGLCGIYTHHQRRSDPNVYSYNVACLEGVNPFDLVPVSTSYGINHISDR
ncbi:GFA family protein [Aeromonas salmonicida]|uniref:GFA family protein n=1 Tax=Aeromonas salmonicida TaxID=645 RepID=UPI003D195123